MALGLSIFLCTVSFLIGGVVGLLLRPRHYDGIFEINLSEPEEEFYRLILETDIESMAKKHHICLKILKL